MWSLSVLTVSSLALIQHFAVGLVLPSNEAQIKRTKRSVNAQTQQELASVIKCNTTIIGPADANFAKATERYMQNIRPQILLSVRPTCEDDVARIVSVLSISIAYGLLTPSRFSIPIITTSRSTQSVEAMP